MKSIAFTLFVCIAVMIGGLILAFTQDARASEACWPSYETPCTV